MYIDHFTAAGNAKNAEEKCRVGDYGRQSIASFSLELDFATRLTPFEPDGTQETRSHIHQPMFHRGKQRKNKGA